MKGLILLIDDSELHLKIASTVLENEGYACHCFTDYKLAFVWADKNIPQLIFLDLQMPKVTGYDLIPIFKQHPHTKNAPIIIMSGLNQADDVKQAIIAGASDYLVKPLDGLVLQEKVRKFDTQVNREDFASVRVPDKILDATYMVQKLKILDLSEFGVRARSNIKVEPGDSVEFRGLSEERFGTETMFVRCLNVTRDVSSKDFIMQFTFVGITENQRQCIRKFCRQLWLQGPRAAA